MEALEEHTERIRMIRDSAGAIATPDDLKRVRSLRYRRAGLRPRRMAADVRAGLDRPARSRSGRRLRSRHARILRAGRGMRRRSPAGAADPLLARGPCARGRRARTPDRRRHDHHPGLAGTRELPGAHQRHDLARRPPVRAQGVRTDGRRCRCFSRVDRCRARADRAATPPASRSRSIGPRTAGTTARSPSTTRRRSPSRAISPKPSRRRRSPRQLISLASWSAPSP